MPLTQMASDASDIFIFDAMRRFAYDMGCLANFRRPPPKLRSLLRMAARWAYIYYFATTRRRLYLTSRE